MNTRNVVIAAAIMSLEQAGEISLAIAMRQAVAKTDTMNPVLYRLARDFRAHCIDNDVIRKAQHIEHA